MSEREDQFLTMMGDALLGAPGTERLGLGIGFLDGLAAGTEGLVAGLESAGATGPSWGRLQTAPTTAALCGGDGDGAPPSAMRVVRKGDAYHLTLDVWAVMDFEMGYNTQGMGVIMWLYSLGPNDTVYVYTEGGTPGDASGNWILTGIVTIVNALFGCRAKVSFVLDKPTDGVHSHIALACSTIKVTPLAMLAIAPGCGLRDGSEYSTPIVKLMAQLYDRAHQRGVIADDERAMLQRGEPVFLAPATLAERASGSSAGLEPFGVNGIISR